MKKKIRCTGTIKFDITVKVSEKLYQCPNVGDALKLDDNMMMITFTEDCMPCEYIPAEKKVVPCEETMTELRKRLRNDYDIENYQDLVIIEWSDVNPDITFTDDVDDHNLPYVTMLDDKELSTEARKFEDMDYKMSQFVDHLMTFAGDIRKFNDDMADQVFDIANVMNDAAYELECIHRSIRKYIIKHSNK